MKPARTKPKRTAKRPLARLKIPGFEAETKRLRQLARLLLTQADGGTEIIKTATADYFEKLAQEFRNRFRGDRWQAAEVLDALSAELGNFVAAERCARHAVERSLADAAGGKDASPAKPIDRAVALGFEEWSHHVDTGPQALNEHGTKVLELIRSYRVVGHMEAGLRAAVDLLERLENLEHYALPELRQAARAVALEFAGPRSIFVMDRIEPSYERSLKDIIRHLQPLVTAPTPLAPIPDLAELRRRLDAKYPWFRSANDWVVRELTMQAHGDGIFYLPPLLLLGPAGAGKTSWATDVSQWSGVPFIRIGVGGMADSRVVEATARGWSTSMPSRPVSAIQTFSRANPIIVFEEFDKPGDGRHNGHVWDSTLKFFERSNAELYYDECLCGHANLSYISWICTANEHRCFPSPLLDRLTVLRVDLPDCKHYPLIVERIAKDFQVRYKIPDPFMPTFDAADWAWLKPSFTSPRAARKATERLLAYKLSHINPEQFRH